MATGPRGVTGPTGPTGPAGADGITGEIEGVVATAAGLPTTGIEPGTIYYVEDEEAIYDYDAVQGWVRLGSIQGPRGATGATGANGTNGTNGTNGADGADGIVGEISGIVATIGDLPTTGIDPGAIYYVEEDGSVHFWDGTDWTAISLATGPRGVTGPTGPTGPQGADGVIGEINGVVATASALPTTGIAPGTIYYVEDVGEAYVYDAARGWVSLGMVQGPRGATGATGATGAAGAAASSHMIIPFASTNAPLTHSNNGEPSAVTLLGYGFIPTIPLQDVDYAISIDASDHSFSLTTNANNENKQMVFSLPFNASIRSIYATVGNYGVFDPPYAVFPYVQLFTAAAGSNNFTPLEGAFAKPELGIGPGASIQADEMRAAHTDGLDIKLNAGTRIIIGAMMEIPGDTGGNRSYWLYFTGGIGLTYEP